MELKSIGKYEIVKILGKGSMGVVYKAQDPEIGRTVAIKTLRTVLMGDDASGNEALQRFKQESRSAGKLQHPNIVTIFEAGRTENGSPYIVMEFIDGESLDSIIATRAPLEPLEVLHYCAQIASAVDYAHSQNVIHRDIKPSNVIVDTHFRPHLLDFGVAKLSDTSLTPAGTVVGTPSYMSPEQIRGEALDGGTDLFALGVMVFELLTSKRPFPGNDFTTVVSNIIHQSPLSFAELGIILPTETEAVLKRVLSKDRKERYQSCLEFMGDLARSLTVGIDSGGLIGGYRAGMRLVDVAPELVARLSAENVVSIPRRPASGITDRDPVEPAAEWETPGQRSRGRSASDSSGDDPERRENNIVPGSAAAEAARSTKVSNAPASNGKSGSPFLSAFWSIVQAFLGGALLLVLFLGAAAVFLPEEWRGEIEEGLMGLWGTEHEEPEAVDVESEPSVEIAEEKGGQSPESKSGSATGQKLSETPTPAENEGTVAEPQSSETPVEPMPFAPRRPGFADLQPAPETLSNELLQSLSDEELAYVLANPDLITNPTGRTDSMKAAIREAARRERGELIEYVARWYKDEHYVMRIEVLRTLAVPSYLQDTRAFSILLSALHDPEYLVRGFAAKILGSTSNPEALQACEAQLTQESNGVVAKILGESIAKLRAQGGGNGGSQ